MIKKGDRVILVNDNIKDNISAGMSGIVEDKIDTEWYSISWDQVHKVTNQYFTDIRPFGKPYVNNSEGRYLARCLGYIESEDEVEQWSLIYDKLFENGFEIVKRVESYVPIPEVEE